MVQGSPSIFSVNYSHLGNFSKKLQLVVGYQKHTGMELNPRSLRPWPAAWGEAKHTRTLSIYRRSWSQSPGSCLFTGVGGPDAPEPLRTDKTVTEDTVTLQCLGPLKTK